MSSTILLVDDEPAIRQMLAFSLVEEGYTALQAADADEAQSMLKEHSPDLILLDWMMPGLSGVDLTRRLKLTGNSKVVPIIMLTAKGEEHDKIKALDSGADDYVTKPFSIQELLARIRALLRRSDQQQVSEQIVVDALTLDLTTHRVTIEGKEVVLSPMEFRLLNFFISHAERVYSRTQILDHVWGEQVYVEERTVDVHIRRLRKILAQHGFDNYIQTVRSVGYRFSST